MTSPASISAIKLALTAQQRRSEAGGADLSQSEPIAIIGLGCRFPGGASTPEQFWRLLQSGTDAVREISSDRWPIDAYYDPDPSTPGKMSTRWAGLLDNVDQFDAAFFGIAPREAAGMDPQQRLLLEVTWEALNHAGYPPEDLGGTATGVFFAVYNSDYARLQFSQPSTINAHTSSGTAHGVAAGRVSYLLNLHGPSMAIDTACSSSLVAIHLACQSLRAGESSLAVAGGVNVLVAPEETISLSRWGMLAPDGRCKTFDAAANGFVRGEGCGIITLKRLADALADGDRIHAVIRGSAVNQDGRSTVLTAPNGLAQEAVLRQALAKARVAASQVTYIETHGTGTSLGDPIEVEALATVLGQPRSDGSTCRLGSVKTNLGHLEAAAGVAGLIKVVLAMQHDMVPPHLHFQKLNPMISLDGTCLEIRREQATWKPGTTPRVAGVSSFGFGGTNAHIVLEEAPRLPAEEDDTPLATAGPWLLPLSAHTPAGLETLAQNFAELLSTDEPGNEATPYELGYTAGTRRRHHPVRAAFSGSTRAELAAKIRTFLDSASEPAEATTVAPGKLTFVFCGHGAHWIGMGHSLLCSEQVFRRSLQACNDVIRQLTGWSVVAELSAPKEQSRLEDTEVLQPVLFSLQTALAALLQSWGLAPDAVIGHSVGEIAAAHVAGALRLEDAAHIAVLRGRLMQASAGEGAMAAIEMGAGEARNGPLQKWPGLCVAAINAPQSITVSGDARSIDELVADLTGRRIFARRLNVNRAFHSPAMAPAARALSASLSGLSPTDTKTLLFSAVEGRAVVGHALDAQYWGRNIGEPVNFASATAAAFAAGCSVFAEIGPHPVLATALKHCADASSHKVSLVASLRRGQDERTTLLDTVGSLYRAGRTIAWKVLYPQETPPVSLPPYPWQRERHWAQPVATGASTAFLPSTASVPWPGHILQSAFLSSVVLECAVSAEQPAFATEHRVCGMVTIPATGLVDLALAAAHRAWTRLRPANTFLIESLAIDQALVLTECAHRTIQVGLENTADASGSFRIYSRALDQDDASAGWTMHAAGKIRLNNSASGVIAREPGATLGAARELCRESLDVDAHYKTLHERGVEFGPRFRGVTELWRGPGTALARVGSASRETADAADHVVNPALLDACLQAVAPLLPLEPGSDGRLYSFLPLALEKLQVNCPLPSALWSFARTRTPGSNGGDDVVADLWIFTDDGTLAGTVDGLRLKRTERTRLDSLVRPADAGWLHQISWESRELDRTQSRPDQPGWCLILADRGDVGAKLATDLATRGLACVLVTVGKEFRRVYEGRYEMPSGSPTDLARLLQDVGGAASKPVAHVVHLGALDLPETTDVLAQIASEEQAVSCGTALHLVQAASAHAGTTVPRLWFVTRNATGAGGPTTSVHPAQGPLAGLVATMALEHPDLRPTLVDLQSEAAVNEDLIARLGDEVVANGTENRIALSTDRRQVARLQRLPALKEGSRGDNRVLCAASTGVLDDIAWKMQSRRPPATGAVEIKVGYAGLNFRDVLTALQVVKGRSNTLGGECAGRIAAVGSGVTQFKVGDEVIAFAIGGLANHVTVPAALVIPCPRGIALEQAASLPVIFLTSLHALRHVASLRAGQKILIHAGTGGVGSAAVQLAMLAGAEIFATAGTPEKRALLKSWGVPHVFDSRSLAFADEIRAIAGERGLEVVLNSLAGEFVPRSLALLKSGGTFVELGKRDLLDPKVVAKAHTGVRYEAFDLANIAEQNPAAIQSLFGELLKLLEDGSVQLPPMRTFAATKVASAFRHMAQGLHTGKIIISLDSGSPRPLVRADAAYLITGGMGALGLRMARWLIDQGATDIALVGRRQPDATAAATIADLRATGARTETFAADVSDRKALAEVLVQVRTKSRALRGIIHAAGGLDDSTIMQLEWPRCLAVMRPKVEGAWNLHALTTEDPLDFFVLFSSAASVLGSSGQGNYAAANAFLDALAHHRRNLGRPALSINWGAWGEAGMVANLSAEKRERLTGRGLRPISSADACTALEGLLSTDRAQVVAVPADWPRYVQGLPSAEVPPLLQDVVAATSRPRPTTSTAQPAVSLRAEISALPRAHRLPRVQVLVERHAAQALGLAAGKSIDPRQPLHELGLDSLMSVELRNALAGAFACSLSATLLFDYPTVETLAQHLAQDALQLDLGAPAPAEPAAPSKPAETDVTQLTESEAEALLLAELNQPKE